MSKYTYEVFVGSQVVMRGSVQAETTHEAYEEVGIAVAENGLADENYEIFVEKGLAQPEN